ncbi:MAG: MBL fold metallo-hydrolase [Flexilinea sp.]
MIRITPLDEQVYITKTDFYPGEKWLVNGAILKGRDYFVVWDTASFPKDMAELTTLLNEKPAFAIYSHADWDHCWGTCGYSFNHVLAHTKAIDRFNNELPSTLKRFRNDHPNEWRGVKLVPPDITFDKKMTIEMGDFSLELYHFKGHTADSIIGFIPEKGLLLGGDSIETVPVINNPEDVPAWIDNLETWMKRKDITQVLPGHGELTDASIFSDNCNYLRELKNKHPFKISDASKFYQQVHTDNCKKMGVTFG